MIPVRQKKFVAMSAVIVLFVAAAIFLSVANVYGALVTPEEGTGQTQPNSGAGQTQSNSGAGQTQSTSPEMSQLLIPPAPQSSSQPTYTEPPSIQTSIQTQSSAQSPLLSPGPPVTSPLPPLGASVPLPSQTDIKPVNRLSKLPPPWCLEMLAINEKKPLSGESTFDASLRCAEVLTSAKIPGDTSFLVRIAKDQRYTIEITSATLVIRPPELTQFSGTIPEGGRVSVFGEYKGIFTIEARLIVIEKTLPFVQEKPEGGSGRDLPRFRQELSSKEITERPSSYNVEILMKAARVVGTRGSRLIVSIFGNFYEVDTVGAKIVDQAWQKIQASFSPDQIINIYGFLDPNNNLIQAQTIRILVQQPRPPSLSGINGKVWLCPGKPVSRNFEEICKPYAAAIIVVKQGGQRVAQVSSDANGSFRVFLSPGVYTLEPQSKWPFPRFIYQEPSNPITVTGGSFAFVNVFYDSGIRTPTPVKPPAGVEPTPIKPPSLPPTPKPGVEPTPIKPPSSSLPPTPPTSKQCVVTGCSSELCVEPGQEIASICLWKPEYSCYRTARCERQPTGQCGWTPTRELLECLNRNRSGN